MLGREGSEGRNATESIEERSRTEITKKSGSCWDRCFQRCEESLKFRFSGHLGKCQARILPQEWVVLKRNGGKGHWNPFVWLRSYESWMLRLSEITRESGSICAPGPEALCESGGVTKKLVHDVIMLHAIAWYSKGRRGWGVAYRWEWDHLDWQLEARERQHCFQISLSMLEGGQKKQFLFVDAQGKWYPWGNARFQLRQEGEGMVLWGSWGYRLGCSQITVAFKVERDSEVRDGKNVRGKRSIRRFGLSVKKTKNFFNKKKNEWWRWDLLALRLWKNTGVNLTRKFTLTSRWWRWADLHGSCFLLIWGRKEVPLVWFY